MDADTAPLSVVIPTYNRRDLLAECLRSLYGCGVPGLEVIVVDDGGTDDTPAMMAESFPLAVYLRQDNAGPAAARNRGFAKSRGKLVAFLDSDDAWLPGVAPRVVELFRRHRTLDVLFADARMGNAADGFVSWIEVAGQRAFRELPAEEPEAGLRLLEPGAFFRRMVERNAVFIGSTVLRREAFAEAGRFDPVLCGAADWELWLRMAARRFQYGYWPEPLAVYRRHAGSMSTHLDAMGLEFIKTLDKLRRWCPAADRPWVAECLHRQLFFHAYRAYDRGDTAEARRRFAELRRLTRADGRDAVYELLCRLPAAVTRRLRRVKQLAAA